MANIHNSENNAIITGTSESDSIYNREGLNVNITSGNGNDTITNFRGLRKGDIDYTTINAGSGNNHIENSFPFVFIYAENGNNIIENSNGYVTISTGDGNNTINNRAADCVEIHTGSGNDKIWTGYYGGGGGHYCKIYTGAGNDSIYDNSSSCTTVDAGEGDDTINSWGYNGLIIGGKGNDYIKDGYENFTIQYSEGDGNDIVRGFGKKSTLSIVSGNIDNANLNGLDVVIKVGSGSMTLKDAKDKEITVIDSSGKEIKFTNTYNGGSSTTTTPAESSTTTGDGTSTTTNLGTFSYSQLTNAQKKEVCKNSLKSLKSLISIADDVNAELSADDFEDQSLIKKTQGWTKFAKFIAKLIHQSKATNTNKKIDNYYSMIDNLNTILINVEDIVSGKKPMNDLSATTAIMDCGANVLDALDSFSDALGVQNEVVDLSLISSVAGLATNVIALADGSKVSDKDRQEFEKAFVDVAGAIVTYTAKAYGLSESVTSPFGPVNAGIAAVTGIVTGIDQFFSSNEKYKADGIATATQNAWIDAFSTGIYEAAHKYTFGADNAIFEGTRFLAYALMGKADEYTESDLNYMEWIGTAAKIGFLGELHGNDADNGLETMGEKTKIVAGAGKDFIIKSHSQVSIYGGVDDDTVGGFQNIGTDKNYIDMGDGNDSILVYDKKSTVLGGKGDDTIKVFGVNDYATENRIEGDEGNDIIYLYKPSSSTIRGGLGNDTILALENSSNIFEYKEGDGIDNIVGYSETDTIRLTRVTSGYRTEESGNDVLLYVGNDSGIILVDAKGKKINVSSDKTPAKEDMNVLEIKGLAISGANLRAPADYEGDIWAGNDENFKSIKVIDGKSNHKNKILAGNSNANSIVGGNGRNSLWGGESGNNTLTGGTSRDQFWYGGHGKDVVTNFSAGNGENNDVVVLFGGELTGINRNGANVALNMSNGNSINLKTNSSSAESVILYSTDGNNISGAKLGAANTKSLNYDSTVNYFQLNGGGTLNVTNSAENNIWLDGSQGQGFSGISNIKVSGKGQNILAGNGENNSIVGGNGTSSLWGGAGNSSDTLSGGNSSDMFWFGKNDGADFVTNATENDSVNLYDISLAEITSANISDKNISIGLNTGANLNVTSKDNISATFMLGDGSRWKYNHTSKGWQSA